MRRTMLVTGFACVAVTAVAATSGADQVATPGSLHLVGKQTSEAGPKGRPHPGSIIVFSGKERGDDSGQSYVHCLVIAGKHGLCTAQFVLKRGTVAVQTAINLEDSPKTITLTITGGTGAYDGARGTAKFTDIGKDKTDEVFTFKP